MSNRPVPDNFVEVRSTEGYPFKTAKHGDVGHDLFATFMRGGQSKLDRLISEVMGHPVAIIWPWSQKAIPSGIHVNMPHQTWCQVEARSSTSRKRLMVLGGVIDSGYQGELYAVLGNFGLLPRVIREGERYAQVIFHRAHRPRPVKVPYFYTQTERGGTGFGSTGQ